jgi:hypothetical protein
MMHVVEFLSSFVVKRDARSHFCLFGWMAYLRLGRPHLSSHLLPLRKMENELEDG